MKDIAAIILAAGRGTRMKSKISKVLHEVHSRPMIDFLINTLDEAGVEKKVVVVAAKDSALQKALDGMDIAIQEKPLGSGDAVKETKSYFSKFEGSILVLCGDTPLLTKDTIKEIIKKHLKEKPSCTMLTARVDNPQGYGRIVRDDDGNITKIVEEKDLSIYEAVIEEINVGCYCFEKGDLFKYIDKIKLNPKKREYYLTDIIEILLKDKKKVASTSSNNQHECMGINSRLDLAQANEIIRKKVLEKLMSEGVTIVDPSTTSIDMEARIGNDTVVYPHTVIEKNVVIGSGCSIGPFARIRPGSSVEDNVEIGNFVELVRTRVSSGTKIKHMTYLGDTEVGSGVNIGAGTITANYDGKKKNKTVIEDGAFIGVGAILIAPVRIGKNAVVGAGSVVTKNRNVPAGETVVGIPARVFKKKR